MSAGVEKTVRRWFKCIENLVTGALQFHAAALRVKFLSGILISSLCIVCVTSVKPQYSIDKKKAAQLAHDFIIFASVETRVRVSDRGLTAR